MEFRYIPNTEQDRKEMLQSLGLESVDQLFQSIPENVRFQGDMQIPEAMTEDQLMESLENMAASNVSTKDHAVFLGAGAYDHYIPSVVKHLAFRSEFYTAYTPYQPEISQGVLQAIFEFQTMISRLTEMDVVNASMYDAQSAMAEAAMMAAGSTRRKRVLVSGAVHPQAEQVLQVYAKGQDVTVESIPAVNGITDIDALQQMIGDDVAAVLVQYPNFYGTIEDLQTIGDMVHQHKGLLIVSVNPLAMGLLKSPGALGADIVVGEGQVLGNSLSFGGPYLGFFATTKALMRKLPGRIVGETVDQNGKRGFVLTLQAREQHIRREKATSNICSNQALNALIATIYMATIGKKGLVELAQVNLQKAHYLSEQLQTLPGVSMPFTAPFFNEFVIKLPVEVAAVNQALLEQGIIGGLDLGEINPALANHMLIAVTEKRTKEQMDRFVSVLKEGIL